MVFASKLGLEGHDPADIKAIFEANDADGSGSISQEELSALLSSLNPDLTPEKVEGLLAGADLNKDGNIDFAEFVDWLLPPFSLLRTIDGFENPFDVSVSDGFLYVCEQGRHRVSIRALNDPATEVAILGLDDMSMGSGDGELSFPQGVFVNSKSVVVGDCGNNRICIFDKESRSFIKTIPDVQSYHMMTDAEYIYLPDFWENQVKVLDPETLENKHVFEDLMNPVCVFVDETHVFIVEQEGHRLKVFSKAKGWELETTIGTGEWGSYDNMFSSPFGVCARSDLVFVSDKSNDRVQVFSRHSWELLHSIGGRSSVSESVSATSAGFSWPQGLAISNGRLWVADCSNNSVKVFSLPQPMSPEEREAQKRHAAQEAEELRIKRLEAKVDAAEEKAKEELLVAIQMCGAVLAADPSIARARELMLRLLQES